jgi:vacuolar-type H+-ATPase subunit I/STV1
MVRLAPKTHSALFLAIATGAGALLFTGFAYPLQSMEVLQQPEYNRLRQRADKIFVITDSDIAPPYDLNRHKAFRVLQIHQDYKYQKIALLVTSLMFSSIAMLMADKAVLYQKIDQEIRRRVLEGEDETLPKSLPKLADKAQIFSQMRQRWQTLSEAQKQQFRAEVKALSEMVESHDTIIPIEKHDITDKFITASYQLEQGEALDTVVANLWNVEPGSHQHGYIKQELTQWLNQ